MDRSCKDPLEKPTDLRFDYGDPWTLSWTHSEACSAQGALIWLGERLIGRRALDEEPRFTSEIPLLTGNRIWVQVEPAGPPFFDPNHAEFLLLTCSLLDRCAAERTDGVAAQGSEADPGAATAWALWWLLLPVAVAWLWRMQVRAART